MKSLRAIYNQDNLVPNLIKKADAVLSYNEGDRRERRNRSDKSYSTKHDLAHVTRSLIEEDIHKTALKKVQDVRDLLGIVWTRPLTLNENREHIDAVLSTMLELKIIDKMTLQQKLHLHRDLLQKQHLLHGWQQKDGILTLMAKEDVALEHLVETLHFLLDNVT